MRFSADSTLASAILYPLNPVTTTFAAEASLPLATAKTLERECKRWLWATWLLHQEKKTAADPASLPERLVISKEMEWIDRYWHHFFRKHPELYREFCLKHFQTEIQHVEEKDAAGPALTRADLKRQLEYLYDRIGEEGVRRWYLEIPEIA